MEQPWFIAEENTLSKKTNQRNKNPKGNCFMGGGQGDGRVGTENYSFNYNLIDTVF